MMSGMSRAVTSRTAMAASAINSGMTAHASVAVPDRANSTKVRAVTTKTRLARDLGCLSSAITAAGEVRIGFRGTLDPVRLVPHGLGDRLVLAGHGKMWRFGQSCRHS